MKHLVIYLLVALALAGCKAFDGSMITVPDEPIHPKLLTLERRSEELSFTTVVQHGDGSTHRSVTHAGGFQNSDEWRLFTNEAERNLMDPFGPKYGSISFNRHVVDVRYGGGQMMLSGLLLTIPNLFGFPFATMKYKVEVEVRVMDRENRLIGKYVATGQSKVRSAYYYGYSLGDAIRKAYADALNDAFSRIRPQVREDAERLNRLLLQAGKL